MRQLNLSTRTIYRSFAVIFYKYHVCTRVFMRNWELKFRRYNGQSMHLRVALRRTPSSVFNELLSWIQDCERDKIAECGWLFAKLCVKPYRIPVSSHLRPSSRIRFYWGTKDSNRNEIYFASLNKNVYFRFKSTKWYILNMYYLFCIFT